MKKEWKRINVSPETHELWKAIARKMGLSLSETLRVVGQKLAEELTAE